MGSFFESSLKIPKIKIDFNPFLMSGSKNSHIFLYPYLDYPGNELIGVISSGLSLINKG